MNKNCIRGRRDGKSWHNTAKSLHSVVEVNAVVGWRRFPCLPGEVSTTSDRENGSVSGSNARDDDREISRGHSSDQRAGGWKMPVINNDTGSLDDAKDRTNIGEPTCAPTRNSNRRAAS